MTQSQLTSKAPTSNEGPAFEGITSRQDGWWIEPLVVATVFTLFGLYATFRAFENNLYEIGPYLSPFYSPNVQEIFNIKLPFSPAFVILWIPLFFRGTCYYYRKAYYRSYFAHPPACGVSMFKNKGFSGEYVFPFVFQNAHRYAYYFAVPVLVFLWYDAFKTVFYNGGFHMSILTLVMFANVMLLSGYTFGCHACRHLVGGGSDCFSCPSNQHMYKKWQTVTKLNEKHQQWAWASLFSVAATDFYIRLTCESPNLDMQLF